MMRLVNALERELHGRPPPRRVRCTEEFYLMFCWVLDFRKTLERAGQLKLREKLGNSPALPPILFIIDETIDDFVIEWE